MNKLIEIIEEGKDTAFHRLWATMRGIDTPKKAQIFDRAWDDTHQTLIALLKAQIEMVEEKLITKNSHPFLGNINAIEARVSGHNDNPNAILIPILIPLREALKHLEGN